MAEDHTSDSYLNTTNTYSQTESLGEGGEAEGTNPLYVLVFGDEEERMQQYVYLGSPFNYMSWDEYAGGQLERGDDALVANYGIDIRILGFEEWDSDDSLTTMEELWYELEGDTEQYLNQIYYGEWWSDIVDAIIGITHQVDPNPIAGLSPGSEYLDQGRIFTLLGLMNSVKLMANTTRAIMVAF